MSLVKANAADLRFHVLPGYAAYLLEHRLDAFVRALYETSKQLDIPLLRFFEGMPVEDVIKLSKEGNVRLLSAIRDNTVAEYIDHSIESWLKNQLPIISKDDVIVEDISLINYSRKHTLREFLHEYTTDTTTFRNIADEVDRFFLAHESRVYKAYINLQHEKLEDTNHQLQRRESQLLEAQSLGKIGSFEWDLTGNGKSTFTAEVYKIFDMNETNGLEDFLLNVHPDDRLKLKGAIEKSMHDGIYECEYRFIKNNRTKILYTRGRVVFENDKPITMHGTVSDVTDRAMLISRLKESEELSKQAQALTNTGNWRWSIEGDIIEWSDEMYRIYGLEPQSEAITFSRFLTFIHDDDRNRRIAEITEAVKTGKAKDYIMRIFTADGKEKILKGRGEVLVDREGRSVGMIGTCQDITNEYRLTAALKKTNEELIRKNRDLESFNFIASHDLQEPLRKIQIFSNRIIEEGQADIPPSLLRYFEKISDASRRMQRMIEDFLVFYYALNPNETWEEVDLNEVVAKAWTALNPDRSDARIHFSHLPSIKGSKTQLYQMMKQLLSNALKFSKQGVAPEVTITSDAGISEDGQDQISISVKDNGIGFDPKYLDRIFSLFQRLNPVDKYPGSGIGLPLCKKIAEGHNGRITADSSPDGGATFTITLPL